MRRHDYVSHLGFPDHSPVFVSGGATQRFDDWAASEQEKLQTHYAEVTNTLLGDLEHNQPSQAAAVYHFILGAPWVWVSDAMGQYDRALDSLLIHINRRGLP